jgi:iron complex transport system ATP-binding protein
VSALLSFERVSFSYDSRVILDDLSVAVARGERVALIGPNGAGKTTLLNLGSGILRPARGRVMLAGRSLASLPARERARCVAMVPQTLTIPFAFSVREIVALGRTPFASFLGRETRADRLAVEAALELTGTTEFAQRGILDLSAGERQRVILAMALAQQPELLLLDEPTANLDLAHQLAFLGLVRELSRQQGLTVVAAVHDLNLAALSFDRIVALHQGQIVADGSPGQVLRADVVESIYGAPVRIVEHPTEPVPLVALVWPNGHRANGLPVEPV